MPGLKKNINKSKKTVQKKPFETNTLKCLVIKRYNQF